jgi:hypothetical protein
MDVLMPAFGGSKPPLQPTRSGAAAWSRRFCQRCVALCKNIRHTLFSAFLLRDHVHHYVWRVGPQHLAAIVAVVMHYSQPPDHYRQICW